MKKTAKIFTEVDNALGFIQDLNSKRNEDHTEPFIYLSAQRNEEGGRLV